MMVTADRPRRQALVTGGSAGLGRAFVKLLAASGHAVVIVDRDPPAADSTHERFIPCDLARRDELDDAIDILLQGGPYDVVILNAGISATGHFEDMPADALVRLIRVNAEAPLLMAATLLQSGAIAGDGRLVFISSLSFFTGYPGAAVYAATKDVVAVFARSIARPCALQGITVSAVFPGPLRTEHAERHAPQDADPARRMLPDEAARLIWRSLERGKARIVPGFAAWMFALAGRLMPGLVTNQMKRLIYDRLGQGRWEA